MYEDGGSSVGLIIELIAGIVAIIGLWKLFVKAGEPGWGAIVPIYNSCLIFKLGGKPMWWILLLFIPVVNIVIYILAMIGLSKNFGRGGGTAAGLIFLPTIFMLILGFGSAEYSPQD
jgi:hypothetical protein